MTLIRRVRPENTPAPTTCHHCGKSAAEAQCSNCGTDRPALAALKNITAKKRALVGSLPQCAYYPKSLCDCGLRGLCVPAA